MSNNKDKNDDQFLNKNISETSASKSEDNNEPLLGKKFGVLHDEDGNIIKIAENAVPPEAWKDQKKAYSDAWENNKNHSPDDDI